MAIFFFSHADLFYLAILQLCAQCHGRWIKVRLEAVSLAINFVLSEHCMTRQKWLPERLGWKWTFCYKPFCSSCANRVILKLINKPLNIIIYMWKTGRFVAKHGHLQSIHRPWHSAGNCKVTYSVFSPASETTSTMKGSHKDKAVYVNITFEVNR